MRAQGERGFSLLELIIALSLSLFVLIGVVSVATSMVRYHFDAAKKGNVTGKALYGLVSMNKEIEDATYLLAPAVAGDVLSGCTNWTLTNPDADKRLDPAVDPDGPGPLGPSQNVSSFYYCVAPAGCGDAPASPCTLYRHAPPPGTACAIPSPGSCGSGADAQSVVNNAFFRRDGGGNFFMRANDVAGVELNYIVGVSTPTTQSPNPAFYKFGLRVGMNKAYNNAVD